MYDLNDQLKGAAKNLAQVIDELYDDAHKGLSRDRRVALVQHHVERAMKLVGSPRYR